MSDFDRNYAARTGVGDRRRRSMQACAPTCFASTTTWLRASHSPACGLFHLQRRGDAIQVAGGQISGLTYFGHTIFSGPLMIVLFIGTLGMVFFLSFRINNLQVGTALTLFMVYAGLLGLMLSSVLLTYTQASIARTFFISAASFGALSLYGYTTQRDLSPIGSFLIMGLFGLILAMVVNIFLKSTGLDFAISAIGVLIFAGLTAWDTQKIKEMYNANDDGTITGRKAVMGALTLYLDFINLFLFLLRFMGDRR